jgi:hypothetical protein
MDSVSTSSSSVKTAFKRQVTKSVSQQLCSTLHPLNELKHFLTGGDVAGALAKMPYGLGQWRQTNKLAMHVLFNR